MRAQELVIYLSLKPMAAGVAKEIDCEDDMKKKVAAMRHLGWPALLICVIFVACQGPAGAQGDGVVWRDYEQVFQEAKEAGKPIYLYFFMDNCAYCRKMETQTFTDEGVSDYLSEHFVPARVHYNTQQEVVKKYAVRGFPTSWFLSPEGDTIKYLPGYVGPEYFVRMLKYIGEGYYETQSLREYLQGS